jgi:hypothetical protein
MRKAGIGYHEVRAGHTTPSELGALVERLVPSAVLDHRDRPQALTRRRQNWRAASLGATSIQSQFRPLV